MGCTNDFASTRPFLDFVSILSQAHKLGLGVSLSAFLERFFRLALMWKVTGTLRQPSNWEGLVLISWVGLGAQTLGRADPILAGKRIPSPGTARTSWIADLGGLKPPPMADLATHFTACKNIS